MHSRCADRLVGRQINRSKKAVMCLVAHCVGSVRRKKENTEAGQANLNMSVGSGKAPEETGGATLCEGGVLGECGTGHQ